MADIVIALVILMFGIIIGAAVSLVFIFIKEIKHVSDERHKKNLELEAINKDLQAQVEDLKESFRAILEEATSNETKYSDAFEYTQAILDGKEDFK